jgi:hypothetical protein
MDISSFVSRRLRSAAVMFFLFGLLLTKAAQAESATIKDITVTNTRDHLLLYFNVTDCFTEDMKKAIDNGINTAFTFFIRLYEVRSFWRDVKIADLRVSHAVQYDNLKRMYVVRLSERKNEVIFVQDFEEAKKLISEVVGLQVIGLMNLRKGSHYQVRLMAELDEIRLPFYLHHVFFFLSLWDFETDWRINLSATGLGCAIRRGKFFHPIRLGRMRDRS